MVARSQPPPMINWKLGRKWFLSQPFPGTHQMTFTMGMKLPCFTSRCLKPLDQDIILSAKRRYKKKLAERYLACVENNKDANSLLKALNIVQATNMIAASWERNLLHHHPELFSQSRVQTPCSRPCTYNRGSSTHPSTRCVEQGSKVVR